MLYSCTRGFYAPSNMVLSVAGKITLAQAVDACKRNGLYRARAPHEVEWDIPAQTGPLPHKEAFFTMPVTKPCFGVAYREEPLAEGDLKRELLLDMLGDLVVGGLTKLYRRLYDEALVNPEFSGDFIAVRGACTVAFTGESDTPRQVVDLLQEEIERMRREGVDPEVFMLVKNQMYGELLGDVEAVDDAAEEAAAACLKGRTLADEIAALAALTVEMTAHYLGIRMNEAILAALEALDEQDMENTKKCMEYFRKYALRADSLLEGHPTWRLSRWLSFARSHGTSPEEKNKYEQNARRLVTRWGSPVDDYAAKIWSGLIRDYYLPRWEHFIQSRLSEKNPDMGAWEEKWVRSTGVSAAHAPGDLVNACRQAIREAPPLPSSLKRKAAGSIIGNWTSATVSTEWSYLDWPVSSADLEKLRGVRFVFTSGSHALEIDGVELLENGKVIAHDRHAGLAGKPSRGNFYKLSLPKGIHANNGCSLRARVRSVGGKSSNGKLELIKE